MAVNESFAEKARRKRREALANWSEEDERQWLEEHPDDEPVLDVGDDWSAYAPDFEDSVSPESREIDNFLNGVDIIDAYNRWCSKGRVENPGNKREGIMIRCPNPAHPDRNPSAWINLDEQVYACGGCGMEGGDIYVIAAYSFGYQVPIRREKFPDLKRDMAQSLGYQVKQVGSKKYVQPLETEVSTHSDAEQPAEPEVQPDPETEEPTERKKFSFPNQRPEPDPATTASPTSQPEVKSDDTPMATVHPITPQPGDEDDASIPPMPTFDWQRMVREDSFLGQWMADATVDNLPPEYYFWLGLAAIGLAARDKVVIRDSPPVKGNIFICLTGVTGIGKSRATQKLKSLLRYAVPQGDAGNGVRLLPSPASAEALIDCFNDVSSFEDINDQGQPEEYIIRNKVAGLVDFNELAVLIHRSGRQGSTLKPTLLEFFDAYGDVTNTSRTHGTVEAREPYATIIATTQPGSIRTLLVDNDTESGFLNRWAFVGGEASTPTAFEDDAFDPEPSGRLLKHIHDKYNHVRPDDPPVKYSVTDEALEYFEDYFHKILWPMKIQEGNDLFSRCDLMIKKFSLLFMLDRELHAVDLDCIKDAIALWQYMEEMYKIIGAHIGVGEFDHCKRAIIKTLKGFSDRHGHGPKPKQFIAAMNRDTRFSSDLIEKVLASMIRMGEVEEVSKQSPDGNVSVRYVAAEAS